MSCVCAVCLYMLGVCVYVAVCVLGEHEHASTRGNSEACAGRVPSFLP